MLVISFFSLGIFPDKKTAGRIQDTMMYTNMYIKTIEHKND